LKTGIKIPQLLLLVVLIEIGKENIFGKSEIRFNPQQPESIGSPGLFEPNVVVAYQGVQFHIGLKSVAHFTEE
tara:strand:+ start:314 stop:532 length:219 start_codon:yes stop_codon:yes gene_type:complete